MRQTSARLALVLMAALSLASCAARNDAAAIARGNDDDDAVCQAGGKVAPGSPDYVACRKDRDVQRQRAEARADRRQRDLGEFMLNHPDRH
ncbi:hypothetical protein ACQR1I_32485 [Bradyrhizobium sp. HKCCYLS2038]|uniref:hypothetical protein n=1 Tax=unclassified Bradyrhizobium TaxID=2631580 RepID=UPI003EBFF6A8